MLTHRCLYSALAVIALLSGCSDQSAGRASQLNQDVMDSVMTEATWRRLGLPVGRIGQVGSTAFDYGESDRGTVISRYFDADTVRGVEILIATSEDEIRRRHSKHIDPYKDTYEIVNEVHGPVHLLAVRHADGDARVFASAGRMQVKIAWAPSDTAAVRAVGQYLLEKLTNRDDRLDAAVMALSQGL